MSASDARGPSAEEPGGVPPTPTSVRGGKLDGFGDPERRYSDLRAKYTKLKQTMREMVAFQKQAEERTQRQMRDLEAREERRKGVEEVMTREIQRCVATGKGSRARGHGLDHHRPTQTASCIPSIATQPSPPLTILTPPAQPDGGRDAVDEGRVGARPRRGRAAADGGGH